MCLICSSSLLSDLNKKINWRPDRVINWAGRRGLKIDADQLQMHFKNHLNSSRRIDNWGISPTADEITAQSAAKTIEVNKTPRSTSEEPRSSVTDEGFLNKVIGDVYESLAAGQFDLKLEYGFRAIELKQKIAENTNVENRLLELLNEIRSQELSAVGVISPRQ